LGILLKTSPYDNGDTNQKIPFLFRFAAEGSGEEARKKRNARKFFGFCTREFASVSEAHHEEIGAYDSL
jgi:hypothetical protein